MQKFVGVWMLFLSFNSLACDICNMSVSLTPDDTKNRISLLYRHRFATKKFTSLVYNPVAISNSNGNRHSGVILLPEMEDQTHTETYSVLDVRGVYNFTTRLRVIGSLPLIQNERLINGESQFTIQGLGDPFVMGKYNLIRTNYTEMNKSNHRLTLGGGVKIPLGKFDFTHNGDKVQHDIQAGTGTWDFLLSMDYIWKYNQAGVMFTTNYKINTHNKEVDYMFGNTSNSALNIFYAQEIKNIVVMPYLGGYMEHGNNDIEDKNYEENTGGSLLFGTGGLQFFYKNFQVEILYQHTLVNNLNGTLQLDTKNRYQVGLTYLFN